MKILEFLLGCPPVCKFPDVFPMRPPSKMNILKSFQKRLPKGLLKRQIY